MPLDDVHPVPERSVSEVVKTVGCQLCELLAQREEITNRIRNLRRMVGALQAFGLLAHSGAAALEGSAARSHDSTSAVENWLITSGEIEVRSDHPNESDPRLRRACRIAMLETSEAVTEEEICRRIRRRGSFPFNDLNLALRAVVRELNAMALAGEVRRIGDSHRRLWVRIPQAKPRS